MGMMLLPGWEDSLVSGIMTVMLSYVYIGGLKKGSARRSHAFFFSLRSDRLKLVDVFEDLRHLAGDLGQGLLVFSIICFGATQACISLI